MIRPLPSEKSYKPISPSAARPDVGCPQATKGNMITTSKTAMLLMMKLREQRAMRMNFRDRVTGNLPCAHCTRKADGRHPEPLSFLTSRIRSWVQKLLPGESTFIGGFTRCATVRQQIIVSKQEWLANSGTTPCKQYDAIRLVEVTRDFFEKRYEGLRPKSIASVGAFRLPAGVSRHGRRNR